jgi:hypothetical protein
VIQVHQALLRFGITNNLFVRNVIVSGGQVAPL